MFGISVALLTPFDADGDLDDACLGEHAAALLARGAHGVTLFGTTGEGASVGLVERDAGLRSVIAQDVPPDVITLGLCGTAVADVAAQVEQGLKAGVRRFLLPPPFYFADVGDAGLFAWHAALFARTPADAAFVLYHIPQVTGVPLSAALIGQLTAAFPKRIAAIKDSSGQWDNVEALLERADLPVLVGDERLLHRAAGLGAAGSICGMANLYPERLRHLFETATEDPELSAETTAVVSLPVVPAMKARLAALTGDPRWEHVRPPLVPLSPAERKALMASAKTGRPAVPADV